MLFRSIAKANAICEEANRSETNSGLTAGPAIEDQRDQLARPRLQRRVVTILRETLADLRELEAPEGDEARAAKITSSLEHVLTAREDQFAAARANDGSAETKAENAFFTASTNLSASAGSYGLSHCQGLGF